MNENVEVEGEIDARFTSYWPPENTNIDMSETVDATPKEAQGTEEMELLPEEVDEDDLNDRQERLIKTAVLNQDKNTSEVAEQLDEPGGYVRTTLRNKVPEWYETTFKNESKYYSGKRNVVSDSEIESVVREHGPMSVTELMEHFDLSRHQMNVRLDGTGLETRTNVDGYHNRAKVAFPPEDSADEDTESGSETTVSAVKSEDVNESDPSVIAEIETVCEYAQNGTTEESRLASHILELIRNE